MFFILLNIFDHEQIGEIDAKPRLYSVLTIGSDNNVGSTKALNQRNECFLGKRYESTAAASDSLDQPAEKYEYQAEVCNLDNSSSRFIYF